MRLEYKAMVKCRPEAAVAYLHHLSRYCFVHSLKGCMWEMLSDNILKQTMNTVAGQTECTYKVWLLPDGVASEVTSGDGKGSRQEVKVLSSSDAKTEMYWMLEPNMDGQISQLIVKSLKEKTLSKLMLRSLKNSAQLDIDYLEKGA